MTIKSNELLTAWLNTSQATHLWGVRDGDYRVDGFKVNSQYFLILQDDDGKFDVFTPLDNDQPVPQVLEQLGRYVEGVYDGADAWDELRSATTAALDAYAEHLTKKRGETPEDAAWDAYVADHVEKPGDKPDGRTDDERALDQPTTEEKIRRSARVSGSCPDIGPEILAEHLMKREPQDALHEAMTALAASEETVTALRRELAALKKRGEDVPTPEDGLIVPASTLVKLAELNAEQRERAAGHQAVREAMAPKRGGTP